MLLLCVSTNYTQSLGHVDQPLQEDSEVLFRDQGEFRKNGEYTYSSWRKIDIVLKFIIESCANTILYSLYAKYMDIT